VVEDATRELSAVDGDATVGDDRAKHEMTLVVQDRRYE
jgi:hypothetical protein